MLVLGARLQMLNSVGIGLFSLNSFISWKGKKFNTKENEWFSAMIALNIHRPEAHLEIRGFNASGFVCLFVLFHTDKTPRKKKKPYIFPAGWSEGKTRKPKASQGDLLWEEPTSCAAARESTCRSGSRLSALRSGMAMCRSYGGNRGFSEEKHPCDVSHAGLRHG